MSEKKLDAVMFDFGGVFVNWEPRRAFIGSKWNDEEINDFFENSCFEKTNDWSDIGFTRAQIVAKAKELTPQYDEMMRWEYDFENNQRTLFLPVSDEMTKLVLDLKKCGLKVYGLSNWHAEDFDLVKKLVEPINYLDAFILSADIGMIKPNHDIYKIAIERFNLVAERTLFVDDNKANINSIQELRVNGYLFEMNGINNAKALRKSLIEDFGIAL